MNNARTLSFIELGKVAGIAGPSILGVTVHPLYGPWIAFRAALLLAEEIDSPGEALGFDPCPQCTARSCIPACPAGAISGTGFSDAQILSQIEGLMMVSASGEMREVVPA